MKSLWRNWRVRLGVALVALSAAIYFVHFLIFGDAHHIFIYLLGDVAFVPVEVLLVTLIIHELLGRRERSAMLKKLNMVIGAFFSEVGTELLARFAAFDPQTDDARSGLVVTRDWTERDFAAAAARFRDADRPVDPRRGDLPGLRDFLAARRGFLLRLLENPNLLEHERFTELLWAVFHLTEELSSRPGLEDLPGSDLEHLAGDIRRAYGRLIAQWLAYMRHLKVDYPYLFSLATRANPLDPRASVVVT